MGVQDRCVFIDAKYVLIENSFAALPDVSAE